MISVGWVEQLSTALRQASEGAGFFHTAVGVEIPRETQHLSDGVSGEVGFHSVLGGSKKQAFGDNIYSRDLATCEWCQLDSHHTHPDGTPNIRNINNDTKTDRVLISDDYIYWGGEGPKIPITYRNFGGFDLCKAGMGHKSNFPDNMVNEFVDWIRSLGNQGYCGTPLDWSKTP